MKPSFNRTLYIRGALGIDGVLATDFVLSIDHAFSCDIVRSIEWSKKLGVGYVLGNEY
jgi:hypothetical protein